MSVAVSPASLMEHFESLPDPRHPRNRRHRLVDVIAIAVCGVMAGCEGPILTTTWFGSASVSIGLLTGDGYSTPITYLR